MAFEVFQNRLHSWHVPQGQVSIETTGRARFCAVDLALIDVTTRVTLLLDRDRRLLGLRQPKHGEPSVAVSVCGMGQDRAIRIAGALTQLDIPLGQVLGMHPVGQQNDMLVIDWSEK